MVIEGKKNLTLVKQGLITYMEQCRMLMNASKKRDRWEYYMREFDSVSELLGAVETNLSRLKTEERN